MSCFIADKSDVAKLSFVVPVCHSDKVPTQHLSRCVYHGAPSRGLDGSVDMSQAYVKPPAVSRVCIDEESRATLTYSAASLFSDPAENDFFKTWERRAAELAPSQEGFFDQSTA